MASCSLPNQLVPQSTISSRSCCCHRKGCFTALLSACLCSSSSSSIIMLQQTIQLVPQHLLQLAAAGRGCPERHTGPSMLAAVAAGSQCEPTKHAQGGTGSSPGWPRRSRIAKAAMVDGQSWSHGQGSRFLGWTAKQYKDSRHN